MSRNRYGENSQNMVTGLGNCQNGLAGVESCQSQGRKLSEHGNENGKMSENNSTCNDKDYSQNDNLL